jgi:hypothetical protein
MTMFDQAKFDSFLVRAQAVVDAHYKGLPARLVLSAMFGRKFIRIVSEWNSQRTSFCFVDRETGDVLKCDSRTHPAKHARGNINDEANGLDAITPYGAKYLR